VNCEYPGLCLLHVIIHVVFVNLSQCHYILNILCCSERGLSNLALKGKVFRDLG
jgi:hypothetical protein